MLTLHLSPLDGQLVRGIYGPNKDVLPERMRFLHPEAAKAFLEIGAWVVVSDMFRSPESSLNAVREKRGAQPPGYSAHNYGLAIDVDIDASIQRLGAMKRVQGVKYGKATLDAEMEKHGWYCHRRDHVNGFEAWHFNFLGVGALVAGQLTSDEIEGRIVQLYGHALNPDVAECQKMLAKLRLYHGELDGVAGPLTREAVRAFERTWGINSDGLLDTRTRRTLAYVSCDRALE